MYVPFKKIHIPIVKYNKNIQTNNDNVLECKFTGVPSLTESGLKHPVLPEVINQIRNMRLSGLLQNISAMGVHSMNTQE